MGQVSRTRLGRAPISCRLCSARRYADRMPASDVNPNTIRREHLWERLWAGLVVLYSVGRALVVWRTLAKYGVNPVVYLIIDVATSWPYGIATARIVFNVLRHRWSHVRNWILVAVPTFIAPDLYLLITAHRAPRTVYVVLIMVIAFLAAAAVATLIQQIRAGRRVTYRDAELAGSVGRAV